MIFSKEKIILGHAGAIYTCATVDGLVYTGSTDKHVARWLVKEGVQDKFAIKFESAIYSIELVGANFLVVGLSSGSLHIFDLAAGKEIKHFTQHKGAIFTITWNEVKKQLIVGDRDGNLSIWNSVTFDLQIYLPLDAGKLRDVSVSSDGNQFAVGCQDGKIRIFDCTYFNELKTISAHTGGVTSVLFHPTNTDQLISGGKDAHLKLWDLTNETVLKDIPAHNYAIYSLISVNNGQTIVSASRDKMIKIWSSDLDFLERLDIKEGGHKHSVNEIRKLDENRFVSVSDDKQVIIWSAS